MNPSRRKSLLPRKTRWWVDGELRYFENHKAGSARNRPFSFQELKSKWRQARCLFYDGSDDIAWCLEFLEIGAGKFCSYHPNVQKSVTSASPFSSRTLICSQCGLTVPSVFSSEYEYSLYGFLLEPPTV